MKKNVSFMIVIITIFAFIATVDAYQEYNIGDQVTYNGMTFYVIKNSSSDSDSVTLLKKKPLTVGEVNKYGNLDTQSNFIECGVMPYYSSDSCGEINGSWNYSNCLSGYATSNVKQVVDNWGEDKFDSNDLVIDSTGYSLRLLTIDEIRNNLGYGESNSIGIDTPTWLYINRDYIGYYQWTMSEGPMGSETGIWGISVATGDLSLLPIYSYNFGSMRYYQVIVRPVVTLKKDSLNKFVNNNKLSIDDNLFKSTYNIGDEIIHNGIRYYVIKNSTKDDDTVIMIKETPLAVDEVNYYGGVGTENNHVNMYATYNKFAPYYEEAYDENGYGGMDYYSNENCSPISNDNIGTSCTSEYDNSNIKYVVDAWAKDNIDNKRLKSARLITEDEFISLSDTVDISTPTDDIIKYKYKSKYEWLYDEKYTYWTMSQYRDLSSSMVIINSDGFVYNSSVSSKLNTVRPVVELYKCTVDNTCHDSYDNEDKQIEKNDTEIVDEIKEIVSVPNTFKKLSIILTCIGIIAISVSLIIFIKNKDKISTK